MLYLSFYRCSSQEIDFFRKNSNRVAISTSRLNYCIRIDNVDSIECFILYFIVDDNGIRDLSGNAPICS